MKKLGILFCAIGLVIFLMMAMPAMASAEVAEVVVGGTAAAVDAEAGTADAAATALSSEVTGQSVGDVSAEADSTQSTDFDNSSGTDEQIDCGGGSTASVDSYITTASAQYGNGVASAEATELVTNIVVTAPEGSPVEVLLEADYSSGSSHAYLRELELDNNIDTAQLDVFIEPGLEVQQMGDAISYAESYHTIGGEPRTVYLYDDTIVFDFATGHAQAWINSDYIPNASAYAEVIDLQIWDPDLIGYVPFGNVNSLMSATDINNLLAAINAILAKSNISMLSIVSTMEDVGIDWAWAHATAMETALLDAQGNPVSYLIICDDDAFVTLTSAMALDIEAAVIPEVEVETTGEKETEVEQASVETTDATVDVLPYTGADAAPLVFLTLGLIGAGLALRRKNS